MVLTLAMVMFGVLREITYSSGPSAARRLYPASDVEPNPAPSSIMIHRSVVKTVIVRRRVAVE